MSVTSCRASQTSCRNVFGGFGGMVLEPKVSLLCSKSTFDPLRPEKIKWTIIIADPGNKHVTPHNSVSVPGQVIGEGK